LYTVEFYPEEGRYHCDGHSVCKVCLSPEETRKNNGLCPKCGKPVVVGVLNRVEELAGRTEVEALKTKRIPFKSIIPLKEILAQMLKTNVISLKVIKYYDKLISVFGNELDMLLKVEFEDFVKNDFEEIGGMIIKMRNGKVERIPGYDGEYGIIKIQN